ncbi:MAG: hypothetical protein IJD70_10440 [Clostridia bacterium]|nr:hypothetical protein [Clostridia bacterium]
MEENNNGFIYTYSAREQAQIKKIREKYTPKKEEEDKLERLIRLDASVNQKATVLSLILGIVGTLILGFGMSICMSELADILGLSGTFAVIIGAGIGAVGAVIAILAYPIYSLVIRREREKIAPEIIRLSDELLK